MKPHVRDAWIDTDTRDPQDGQVGTVGDEINFNRYFCQYRPPRPLKAVEADIRVIEGEVVRMLAAVTGVGLRLTQNVGTSTMGADIMG